MVNPMTSTLNLNAVGADIGTTNQEGVTVSTHLFVSAGNVGIGAPIPSQKLDVAGYIKGQTGLCIGNDCRTSWPSGGGGTLTGSGTANYVPKWTDGTSLGNSVIFDNGNVGIGATNPGTKLDVTGTIRGGNADTNIGNHPTYGTGYSAFWRQGADYTVLTDGTNSFLNAPVAAGNIYFRTANADKMTILGSSGNVGIGNPNPTYKLDVNGNLRTTILYDRDNTGYYVNPASTSRLNYGIYDNLYSYGNIASPKFRAFQVMNMWAGPLPRSTTFSTNGGTILLIISGSGFATACCHIGMNILVDGSSRGVARVYTNELSSHKSYVSNSIVISLGAGSHTITLNPWLGVTDGNDFFDVTIIEFPF